MKPAMNSTHFSRIRLPRSAVAPVPAVAVDHEDPACSPLVEVAYDLSDELLERLRRWGDAAGVVHVVVHWTEGDLRHNEELRARLQRLEEMVRGDRVDALGDVVVR